MEVQTPLANKDVRSSRLAVSPRSSFATERVELDLPVKHPFDEKRLLIVVDLRTQSYDSVEWHLVERFLRGVNPRRVWFSDVHPVRIGDVVNARDAVDLLRIVAAEKEGEILRRIEAERRARLSEGWNCVINRWQTTWL